ncbi:endonuclease V [Actinophytocola sp.]|uniref:endonuclease V n=1 Tax=Actinophytocola sp. TaxID=1872138 RepID=UPI002ED1BAD6
MKVPGSVEEAVRLQTALAPSVVREPPPDFAPATAAGLDVAYAKDSPVVAAAVVTVSVATGEVLESATAVGRAEFPYVPGLFAFRELPTLLEAFARLTVTPDLLLADGHGLAHPRRFGLACHLGLETGLPTIGVAKTPMASYDQPGQERGARTSLMDGKEEVGAALRTQSNIKPIFVSIGHRIDLNTACTKVLALSNKYRLPETTRQADHLSRITLAEHND